MTTRWIVALGLVGAIVGTVVLGAALLNATAAPVPTTVAQDIEAVRSDAVAQTLVSVSSNPYDYADSSPAISRLVAKGTPALPRIEAAINQSANDGLEEYMLVIAAEQIAKVKIGARSGDPLEWQTGKEWVSSWRRHLLAVPGEVQAIAHSSMSASEKNLALTQLGTPALPFVLDEMAAGNSAVAPAANALASGEVEVGGDSPNITVEWAKKNRGRFATLRAMVQGATSQ